MVREPLRVGRGGVSHGYRYHGHHVGDINRAYYRSKKEEADWKANRDPITLFGAWLAKEGIASEDDLTSIRTAVSAEAKDAVNYALDAPYPDGSEVDMHVFAEADHA